MPKLTEQDLTMLRDSARRFFTEQMPVSMMRRLRDEQDPLGFDPELWRAMAAMGWAGILIDEQLGGVDLGFEALGVILEQSGRTLAASPLLSSALLGAVVLARSGQQHHKALLPAIAAGECLVALAADEQRRHAPHRISTRATARADGYVINGEKTFVLDGHVADHLIVAARTAGANDETAGVSLFCVDANTGGVNIVRTHMVDGRNAASVRFDNVEVPGAALLGSREHGCADLDYALDAARVGIAAEMLGAANEAFDRTINYLKIRNQFDVPIGSFQALKHRAAVMFCELELTRSTVHDALLAFDEQRDDIAACASLAKAKAASTFELVSNEAIQMHGGIGMTDAEEIGLFLKRARVTQQTFGDALYHRDRWASLNGL